MTKAKIDPHILVLREHCIKTADMIINIVSNKPSVTDEQRARLDADYPELVEMVNKAPCWPEHLTRIVKRPLDKALMLATQIDVNPSIDTANAFNPRVVAKTFRMILEAQPPQKTDKVAERLPDGDRDKKCPRCHYLIYRFDKHKNRIRPDSEVNLKCPTCKKYRTMLQEERTANQKTSDAKGAKRKAKEARGKPDPEYVKARKKRQADLRSGKFH